MLSLTPNRRLAAFLSLRFNQQQIAANRRSWQTPEIYPLDAWLSQLWNLQLENSDVVVKPVLSKLQQQVLWEKIIQESSIGPELLRVAPTAKNALQAWKFMCQWQVSVDKLAAYAEFSVDTAAFYAWLQAYLAWLTANNYTDFNLMLDQLINNIPNLIDKLPTEICLMGIDDLYPQIAQLFKNLAANDIKISYASMVEPGAELGKVACANVDAELQAAAQWALEHISTNPQQIIGIVVPNLEQIRQQVVRTFTNLIPASIMNISAPLPLASYMLIDTALLILQLAKTTINFADLSILLRSPFIADADTELGLRAILDRQLRDKVEAKINWEYLSKLITATDSSLQQIISTWSTNLALTKGKHNPEHWLKVFQSLLSCWGWPGERALTVEEAHLLSCWQDLLHSYCQLAVVVEDHTYMQALQLIQRLAGETPFLPAETGLTRIHILGVLEGSGILFDQLWITSMHRDNWPPDAAPNPFIPLELQRQYDMPRSSPQRELKVARRLTDTLKQGAKHAVIFSYPLKIDDQHTQASNLIAAVPDLNYNTNTVDAAIPQNLQLEQIIDNIAPAVTAEQIRGGANVLKLQAQCPFKAYAELRLQAKVLYEPELILTANDRGNIVHEVMEDFWNQTKDQSQLLALLPEALTAILMAIIIKILDKQQRKLPHTLTNNYKLLETGRLLGLIVRWLEYEKTREPFIVQQIEQKLSIIVGPLSLNLRIDRVDQLSDGAMIIIDYKTGASQISSWTTDRIVEPQLPLYTLQYDQTLVALAIASMKPDDLRFKGISANADILPGVRVTTSDWSENLSHWHDNLNKTADEFANGNALVDPYSPQVCAQCKLHSICRIYDC